MSSDKATPDAPTPGERAEIEEIRERHAPEIEAAGAKAKRGHGMFTIHAYGLTSEPLPIQDLKSDMMSLAQEVVGTLEELEETAKAGTGGGQIFIEEVRKSLEWIRSHVMRIRAEYNPTDFETNHFDCPAEFFAKDAECDKWLDRSGKNLELLDRLAVREAEICRRVLNRTIEVAQGFVDATARWSEEQVQCKNLIAAQRWEHKRDTAQQIVNQLCQLGAEIAWAIGGKAMPLLDVNAALDCLGHELSTLTSPMRSKDVERVWGWFWEVARLTGLEPTVKQSQVPKPPIPVAEYDRALDIATTIATQHQFTGHNGKKCGEPGTLTCGLEIAARIQDRKVLKGPAPRPSAAESDSDEFTPTKPPIAGFYWFERREGYIDVATLVKVWWIEEVGWVQMDLELGTFTPLNECEGKWSKPLYPARPKQSMEPRH